jgi:hypothetical protein
MIMGIKSRKQKRIRRVNWLSWLEDIDIPLLITLKPTFSGSSKVTGKE